MIKEMKGNQQEIKSILMNLHKKEILTLNPRFNPLLRARVLLDQQLALQNQSRNCLRKESELSVSLDFSELWSAVFGTEFNMMDNYYNHSTPVDDDRVLLQLQKMEEFMVSFKEVCERLSALEASLHKIPPSYHSPMPRRWPLVELNGPTPISSSPVADSRDQVQAILANPNIKGTVQLAMELAKVCSQKGRWQHR